LDAIDNPSSRVLFTIKEEDKEEVEIEKLLFIREKKIENVLPVEWPKVIVVDFKDELPILMPFASPPSIHYLRLWE